MALPLVTLEYPASENESFYKLTPVNSTLNQLKQNFPNNFTSILFVGKMNSTLRNILPLEFVKVSKSYSLLVWPQPVVFHGKSLLLIKTWEFNPMDTNEARREVIQRCLTVFLSITQHCVTNFEASMQFCGLSFLQQFCVTLQEKGLHKVHFLAETINNSENQSLQEQENAYKQTAEAKLTDFVSEEVWEEPESLFDHMLKGENNSLFSSVQIWAEALQMVSNFANVVNIDSNSAYFVQHFPRLCNFEESNTRLQKIEHQLSVLRKALKARKFLIKNTDHSLQINQSLFNTLDANFDKALPTVVLTVIGGPGIGKSTFLNSLIQRAFQRRSSRPHFKTRNSASHTTKGSVMFPIPLPVHDSDHQMLLIDLEGLGGLETSDDKNAVIQYNLVSGILAVSSIPCIFVRNEETNRAPVEQYIARLETLSRKFSLMYKRVYFFFIDKDFPVAEQAENVFMQDWIKELNRKYFDGREIICLMNKPSFADSNKAEMCNAFLDALLKDCNYPKLSSAGSPLRVVEMFRKIQLFGEYPSNDITKIADAHALIDRLANEKQQELEERSLSITYNGTLGLVTQFNELYYSIVSSLTELWPEKSLLPYIERALEDKAQELREMLLWTEVNFETFSEWDEAKIKQQIDDRLDSYYKKCIIVKSFWKMCESLENRLKNISRHYPAQRNRTAMAIAHLDGKRSNLSYWYYGHYTAQLALLVGTAGLGIAGAGVYYTTAIGLRSASCAWMFGYSAAVTGVTAAGQAVGYLVTTKSELSNAHSLFVLQEDRKIEWNTPKNLFMSNSEKSIVLILAHHSFSITQVLNSLVGEGTTLVANTTVNFQDGLNAQVISFNHPNIQAECVLMLFTFCGTYADSAIALIANAIFDKVSMCCLCVSEKNEFALDLLSKSRLPSKLYLVLRRSLDEDFKNNLRAKIIRAQFDPEILEAEEFDSDVQSRFKVKFIERMRDSRLLSKENAEDVFKKAQDAIKDFGLQ